MKNPSPPPPAMKNPSSTKQPTTSPAQQSPPKKFGCSDLHNCTCTLAHLGCWRFLLKILQLGLSSAALVLQAGLEYYTLSGGHIFFAIVSSCGLFFSLLILVLYCTKLYEIAKANQVTYLDIWLAAILGALFPIASTVLIKSYDGRSNKTAVVMLGFAAGHAFIGDALWLGCDPWEAEKDRKKTQTGP